MPMDGTTDEEKMAQREAKVQASKRKWWMLPFEFYFGICIKYINPACLLFIFFEALANDLATPYGIAQGAFPALASLYVAVAVVLIIVPMFACAEPESFSHNVEAEFNADDIFEIQKRLEIRMKQKMSKKMGKALAGLGQKKPAADTEMAPVTSINAQAPVEEDLDKEEN